MEQKIKDLVELQQFFDQHIPGVIIRLTGSNVLPYIPHSHDCDVLAACYTREQLDQCWNLMFNNERIFRGFDIHPRLAPQHLFLGLPTYEYHFMDPIPEVPYPSIYDAAAIQYFLNRITSVLEDEVYKVKNKSYYHIFTTIAMLCNGDYLLTDEDITYIRRFHDMQTTIADWEYMKLKWQHFKEINNYA